jgi:ribonuclease BN (tRNA processing enzyme)
MSSIQFLGTGGGRFVILSQMRYTGGLWLESGKTNILIDPGPGALIRCLQFKKELRKLDAVLVSHKHLDHYNDAEICVEGMTEGMNKKRGRLIINKNVEPYISEYHRDIVNVQTFDSVKEFEVGDIRIKTTPTFDHDDAFGFRFSLNDGVITYSSDTNYKDGLIPYYTDSDILILNVLRPANKKITKHLSTAEAREIIEKARPKLAVLNHFGILLVRANPDAVARDIQEKTGVETIAAKDGMVLDLGKKKEQPKLLDF